MKLELQERFFLLQRQAMRIGRAYLFLLEGWAQTGKGKTIQELTERLDPRKYKVHSPFLHESVDKGYPFLKSFWNSLPRYGEFSFFVNTYYGRLAFLRACEKISEQEFEDRMTSILNTERLLTKDNYSIIKFFFSISKKEFKKRLEIAEKKGKTWQSTASDLSQWKNYDRYQNIFSEFLKKTNAKNSPWIIVEENESIGQTEFILQAILDRMDKDLDYDSKRALQLVTAGMELIP